MNSANTSEQYPAKEKGEDLTGLLVVVVAVLGTLVAVGILIGGMWACVMCGKKLYPQRKRNTRQKFGNEEFPPQPRETVEMGHISHHPHFPYHVSNSGFSRSFGLRTSPPAQQIPVVPAPKSWTPSPPFDCDQNHAALSNAQYSPCIMQKMKPVKRARHGDNHSSRNKGVPKDAKGNPSIYHPGYNTLASDMWSVQATFSGSASSHASCSESHSCEEREQQIPRNSFSGKRHKTRWRRSMVYDKEPHKCSRHRKKVRTPVDSQSSKYRNRRYMLDEDTEAPDACSSHRGSSHLRHHLNNLTPHQQHSCPSGAEISHHKSREPNAFTHKLHVISGARRKSNNTQNLTSNKSRRLWHESCILRNEVRPLEHTSGCGSGPSWMHRYQTERQQCRQKDSLLDPPLQFFQESSITDEDYEREIFQRIARKYGFCETCGHQKSLKRCEAAGGEERNLVQLNDWDEPCGSSSNEPTPSMSWDNLTLEPSPALTNKLHSQGVEGTVRAQSNEENVNEMDAGDVCGIFAPTQENTYTIACQNGGEA